MALQQTFCRTESYQEGKVYVDSWLSCAVSLQKVSPVELRKRLTLVNQTSSGQCELNGVHNLREDPASKADIKRDPSRVVHEEWL